jgi:hypothetical protein
MMLALSFWRPWPFVILHEDPDIQKRFENRTWRPSKRYLGQEFALHATVKFDSEGSDYIESLIGSLPKCQPAGAVVGTFRLMGFFRCDELKRISNVIMAHDYTLTGVERGAKWIFGPEVWVLDDIRRLEHHVPCRGQQGIWKLSPELTEQVKEWTLPQL